MLHAVGVIMVPLIPATLSITALYVLAFFSVVDGRKKAAQGDN